MFRSLFDNIFSDGETEWNDVNDVIQNDESWIECVKDEKS